MIFRLCLDPVVVLMYNYFFDKLYSRIILAGIFFSFGFDHDFRNLESSRLQQYFQIVILFTGLEIDEFSIVSQ